MARSAWLAPFGWMPDPGDIIGFKRNGDPIRLLGGGARNTYEDWIPEEWDSQVITRVRQMSALEAYARRHPMASDTRNVPRSAGVGVESISKGGSYGEDTSANDSVTLTARKLGKAIRIAEEDLQDSAADILATKRMDWATSYAKFLDNACLGVTAAENGTTIPFTSLYKALRTTNSDTSYTADANYVVSASGSAVSYTNLSQTLGLVEESDYWDDGMALVIAHPSFKRKLREIKDDQNRPIFVAGQGGDSGTPDTLFGHPVRWSLGAKTHATATDAPTGNPLLFVGNRDYLFLGIRSGPESAVAGADTGAAFLTDEALLKMRSRRGFACAHEKAWAVLEDVA